MSTGVSCEGEYGKSLALAMRHRHSGISIYCLDGPKQGDEYPAFVSLGVWYTFLYPYES